METIKKQTKKKVILQEKDDIKIKKLTVVEHTFFVSGRLGGL